MMMRKIIIPALFLVLCIPDAEASQESVRIITANESSWSCYDYAVAYHAEHPETFIITEGYTRTLRGPTHVVCGEFINNGEGIRFYDGMRLSGKMIGDGNYTYPHWRTSGKCFHFWVEGETPARNYKNGVRDNSHLFPPERFNNTTV